MDIKGTKMFISLLRDAGCLKMPGDEQKNINRAENHAMSAIISCSTFLQTTDKYYDMEGDK